MRHTPSPALSAKEYSDYPAPSRRGRRQTREMARDSVGSDCQCPPWVQLLTTRCVCTHITYCPGTHACRPEGPMLSKSLSLRAMRAAAQDMLRWAHCVPGHMRRGGRHRRPFPKRCTSAVAPSGMAAFVPDLWHPLWKLVLCTRREARWV